MKVPLDIYDYEKDHEEYRDSIATVDKSGKRIWIYPKKVKGFFTTYRKFFGYSLLILLFVFPFIKVNDGPLLLFNILDRKFILWGQTFFPQDFYIFLFLMLAFMVFIILFTLIFGRLFCGWACPQTIFMEMVFRPIEYLIEGDATAQIKLNKSPWTGEKILKKFLKHTIYFIFSFLIANLFLSYIIGLDEVLKIMKEPINQHLSGFIAITVFSFLFYGVFAFMREQVCTTICPYGRLQGVLLDKNSIVISYDYDRGEPRGKINKKEESPSILGDCVDCNLCVRVCPTGIDIRNGTQLECINCTACIDACDEVMIKVGRPKGLIKYTSENALQSGINNIWTPRTFIYGGLLILLLVLNSFLIFGRSDFNVLILKSPGTLYQEAGNGQITNLYTYEIVNKSGKELKLNIATLNPNFEINVIGSQGNIVVKKDEKINGALLIKTKTDFLKSRKTELDLEIKSTDEKKIKTIKFIGPIK